LLVAALTIGVVIGLLQAAVHRNRVSRLSANSGALAVVIFSPSGVMDAAGAAGRVQRQSDPSHSRDCRLK
jgi:hypothetical protein